MNQVRYSCMYCDLYDYTDAEKWHKQKYNSDNGEELAKAIFVLWLCTVETQVICFIVYLSFEQPLLKNLITIPWAN